MSRQNKFIQRLSTRANEAAVRNHCVIVTLSLAKQKVSFVFRLTIDLQKMPLGKLRVVCIRNISKTKSKPGKKIQGDVFLFN